MTVYFLFQKHRKHAILLLIGTSCLVGFNLQAEGQCQLLIF